MSCSYALGGLPKGKGWSKAKRVSTDLYGFFSYMQRIVEKSLGCYFYDFIPSFYVCNNDTIMIKIELSQCPSDKFLIIKAPKTIIPPYYDMETVKITISLYRNCCLYRSLNTSVLIGPIPDLFLD